MTSKAAFLGPGFSAVIRIVRSKFPFVPRITTDKLDQLMKDENDSQKLVLLDIREPIEIEVSRLPDSIPVKPAAKDMTELLSTITNKVPNAEPKNVVGYCAVGWRASIMAKRLMAELAKPENYELRKSINVSILEGSIFKWGNERRQLIGPKDETTDKVHGVGRGWDKLLDEDIRTRP